MIKKVLLTVLAISMLAANITPALAAGTDSQLEAVAQTEENEPSASGEVTEKGPEKKIEIPSEDLPDNSELFAGYLQQKMYGNELSLYSLDVSSVLSQTDKKIYDILKDQIEKVANGKLSSSVFEISLKDVYGFDSTTEFSASDLGVSTILENGDIAEAASNAIYAKITPDYSSIIHCLLLDCPYELYWYDKTIGMTLSYPPISGNSTYLRFSGDTMTFTLKTASEYSTSKNAGTTEVDTALTGAAAAAVTNAKEIVSNHSSEDDHTKLSSYRQEICDLVSYNSDAASNDSTPYGNPWQLIWVFDKDSATNVVCEGYSKAFQYLCDLSEFNSSSINCWTVSGNMSGGTGAGAHMWNIITMDDNKNYLVDVTNCDAGTIGAADKLFLAVPTSGTAKAGYTFRPNSTAITYTYDSDMGTLYDNSILTLSSAPYSYCSHTWNNGTITTPATCETDGTKTFTCSSCQATKTETLQATGHAYGSPIFTWAEDHKTCTVTLTCTNNSSHSTQAEAAVTSKVKKAATCTEKGITAYTATYGTDSDVKYVDIPVDPNNHVGNTELRNDKAATCSEEGYTGDEYCTSCNTKISTGNSITKLSHNWDSGEITAPATCETDGTKTFTCSSCQTTKTETIQATGHAYGSPIFTWAENHKTCTVTLTCANDSSHCKQATAAVTSKLKKAATCTEKGITAYTATYGTDSDVKDVTDIPVDPNNHVGNTELRNANAATCSEEGYTGDEYCTSCNTKISTGDSIAMLSHKWNDGVTTAPATCETDGTKTFTCSSCQATKTETLPATGHAYGSPDFNWAEDHKTCTVTLTCANDSSHSTQAAAAVTSKVKKAATCTEAGITTYTATYRTDSDVKDVTDIPVDPKNHVGNTELRNAKEATCSEEGYTGDIYCTSCNTKISTGKIISKLTTTAPPATIKVSRVRITGISKQIAAGKKITLSAVVSPANAAYKNLKWTSSNSKIATVTQRGVVTIKKNAAKKTVTITAKALDGSNKKATYKIKVMKGAVKKVTISGAKAVKAGKNLQLKGKVTAATGANKKLKWISSNTKYATVSSSGKVKTLKAGKGKKVKITAMATDGSNKKKTVVIKIK